MKRCIWLTVAFSLILLLLAAGAGFADTWYVATDGSDSDPGTQSQPFATIQEAVDSASDGDTILVEAGTYYEDVIVYKDRLTLRSLVTWGATIDGVNYGIELTGNGLTVEKFTIENSDCGIAVNVNQTEDVKLSSNWISNTQTGIYFHWNAEIDGCSFTIEDNIVYSTGNGIFMEGDMGLYQDVDIKILDNSVDGPSSGIILNYIYGGNVEISDNSLYECSTAGIYVDEIDPDGESVSFKIENNNIDFSGTNGSYGIYMNNAERTTWVKGNTVTGDYDSGIHIEKLGVSGSDPLLVYVDENKITGGNCGIYLVELFADMTGSIYLRKNVIADCFPDSGNGDGIHLKYIGYTSNASGFNLYCEENVIFECEEDGLDFENLFYGSTGKVEVRHNSFLDNDYGLYISHENYLEDSIFVVENNNFEGNLTYGLLNDTVPGTLIDAKNNWWGDPSGPYDPDSAMDTPSYDNPNGLGDTVSEYVDYSPWRESPYISGEESSGGGCNTGASIPGLLLLILPLLALARFKKNI